MAWITKNSGTMQIERRDQPYLTQAMKDRLAREVLPRYERSMGALLPCLHEVQHAYGWIPHQAMMEVADFLKIKPSDVIDTVTFYEEYWTRPRGKHLIQVCRSIACEFCGHERVTQAVRDRLGIDVGETTDDGLFTLIELECLGSCDTAPVALINEQLHERLSPEAILKAIDDIKGGKAADAHH
ncbi:MAG TPA: NADH-quinone oxidoreductase subunit NuoE [Phycisphaerales bacterium]|nr:NADH-quinone oxidoreductase subunit NuoE [Phycisphaerales bacterium]